MSFDVLNRKEHPDVETKDRGGYILKDDRTTVRRCFTPITDTHASAMFKLYEGGEKAEYDYYGVVSNRGAKIFGFDEAEYLATISALESTPFIVEHRSPAQDDEEIPITTVR